MEAKYTTTILLVLLACVSGVLTKDPVVAVDVEMSQEDVSIGDTVIITCKVKVSNPNADPPVSLWAWVKKAGDEEVEIGTNDFINKEFKTTGRYESGYDYDTDGEEKGKMEFTLTIRDIRPEDSGEIGCRIPANNVEVFKDLIVYTQVKKLELEAKDVKGSGQVIKAAGQNVTFKEGERRQISCTVDGSYPKPTVKLTVGDKDITDKFEKTETLNKKGKDRGLQVLTYKVVLDNEDMEVDYHFSKKKFQCVASVPGSGLPPISKSMMIILDGYSPKFECHKTVQVKLHQRDVEIRCTVRADPPPHDFNFLWQRQSVGNVSINSGAETGEYSADIENGKDMYEQVMILRIQRVYIHHFRKYIFKAENDLGTTQHEILLEQDMTAAYSGDAAHLIVSTLTLVTASLFSMIL